MSDNYNDEDSLWATGLGFAITASIVGACSKLCIRKSYTLLMAKQEHSSSSVTTTTTNNTIDEESSTSSSSLDAERLSSTLKLSEENFQQQHQRHCCATSDTHEFYHDMIVPRIHNNTDDNYQIITNSHQRVLLIENDKIVPESAATSTDNTTVATTTSLNLSSSPLLSQQKIMSSSPTSYNYDDDDDNDEKQNENHILLLQMNKIQAWLLRCVGLLGMIVVGPSLNIYALQYASPSILSPIGGGLTLIWIILLSEYTIGEKPRFLQIIAVFIIGIGQILIAIKGDHTNVYSLTLEQVHQQYFFDTNFLIYLAVMVIWIIILILFIIQQHGNNNKGSLRNNSVGYLRRKFAWGVIGGSITGMQCFIKDALALMHGLNINNENNSNNIIMSILFSLPWELCALLIMGGILPLIGLALLMESMKRYDATYASSMFMGSIVLSASIMSSVHYHTFDHISSAAAKSALYYILGLVCILVGTTILAFEAAPTTGCNDDDDNDVYKNMERQEELSLKQQSSQQGRNDGNCNNKYQYNKVEIDYKRASNDNSFPLSSDQSSLYGSIKYEIKV